MNPGDRFDRYRVDGVLGRGGMGEVYVAYDEVLRRQVALKILHGSEPGGEARLLREARAAAAIDHVNAVRVFDVGEVGGVAYLTMELLAGATLRAQIRESGAPLATKIAWLVAIARALEAAHARGVIHRDVKPENVIVGDDGVVKVLDFGIARRTETNAESPEGAPDAKVLDMLATDGRVRGTLPYMAPEQLRGKALDGRVDQWAWGVVAFELLTGRLPWDAGNDAMKMAAQILTRAAPRMRGVPAPVAEVVRRALEKRSEARFESMGAAITAIETAQRAAPASEDDDVAEEVIRVAETRTLPQSETSAQRRAVRLWAIAAAVVAVVALVGGIVAKRAARPLVQAPTNMAPSSPVPVVGSVEAQQEYERALQAIQDAEEIGVVHASLDRAIKLDRDLAGAYLWKVLYVDLANEPDADERALFEEVMKRRDRLTPADAALVDAIEPYYRVPANDAEMLARLASSPSPVFELQRCFMLVRLRNFAGARDVCLSAVARDGAKAIAFLAEATRLAMIRDVDGSLAAYRTCAERSPRASRCVREAANAVAQLGKCEEFASLTQRLVATTPDAPQARRLQAIALYALAFQSGAGFESYRSSIAEYAARSPAKRVTIETYFGSAASTANGDLEDAIESWRRFKSFAAKGNDSSLLGGAILGEFLLLVELARDTEAAALARQTLAEQGAWSGTPAVDGGFDWTLKVYRAGGISRARMLEARKAWEARGGRVHDAAEWVSVFGWGIVSRQDALEALEALDKIKIEGLVGQAIGFESMRGQALHLVGRDAEAAALLRVTTRKCNAALWPAPHIQAYGWLAESLAATGDTAGACEAAGVVLRHWGHTAGSVTAARARATAKRLHCPN